MSYDTVLRRVSAHTYHKYKSFNVRRAMVALAGPAVSLFMHFHGNLLHERFPTESVLFLSNRLFKQLNVFLNAIRCNVQRNCKSQM